MLIMALTSLEIHLHCKTCFVTEVEHVLTGRYSSQRQLRLGL